MRAIRIPYRVARYLRQLTVEYGSDRERAEMLPQLDSAMAVKRSVKASRVRRTNRKASRNAETAALRAKVFASAKDICEACGGIATDLEHAFGRVRVKQKPSNCLALCRTCHRCRTNSNPSAAYWWDVYAGIFEQRGDFAEAKTASDFAAKRHASDFLTIQKEAGTR